MIEEILPGFLDYHSFFWKVYEQNIENYNWYIDLLDFCFPKNPNLVVQLATQFMEYFPLEPAPYQFLAGAYFRLGDWEKSQAILSVLSSLLKEKLDNTPTDSSKFQVIKTWYITVILKLSYVQLKMGDNTQAAFTLWQLDQKADNCSLNDDLQKKRQAILFMFPKN